MTKNKQNKAADDIIEEPKAEKTVEAETESGPEKALEETNVKESPESNGLPPGVTEAPRNEEEMDLGFIRDKASLVKAYLAVSDDQGELLGDMDLESEVIHFNTIEQKFEKEKVNDPEAMLLEVKELATRYAGQINFGISVGEGIFTKHRLRFGGLLNLQRRLVKMTGQNFIPWFHENYGKTKLRSGEDCMKLAKIPGIIKYSVFGFERLKQIHSVIKGSYSDDPIGKFLTDNGIEFDPAVEAADLNDIKVGIKTALDMEMLEKKGLSEITRDRVGTLNEMGVDVKKHMRDLLLLKKNEVDPNSQIDILISNGGKAEPVMTTERRVEHFNKTASVLIKSTEEALEDAGFVSQIKETLLSELKAIVSKVEEQLERIS